MSKLHIKKGDTVSVGDTVAAAPDGALGVAIHTSISGVVKEVTDKYIIVSAK